MVLFPEKFKVSSQHIWLLEHLFFIAADDQRPSKKRQKIPTRYIFLNMYYKDFKISNFKLFK
jgi:hypothetical protein